MKWNVRVGTLCITAVLILAALLRFISLDLWPLSDYEAEHALAALELESSEGSSWLTDTDGATPSPLYHFLTSLVFDVFGPSNTAARWIPASAGLLLLLAALQIKDEGSLRARLIWLVLLCASPVLLTLSRTASGDMLAATCIFFLVMNLFVDVRSNNLRMLSIVLTTGVVMTTGSGVFRAFSGMGIALLLALVFDRGWTLQVFKRPLWVEARRLAWLAPLVAILLLSGFGSSLTGMRGFSSSLGDWMMGWYRPGGYSFLELMVLLIRTEPLILLFGVIGAVSLWRGEASRARFLAHWSIGGLIFLILYPGRSPFDLIWIILPLSYTAALAIEALFSAIGDLRSKFELIALVALLITFVASGVLSIVAYGSGNVITINPENPNLVLFLFIALAVMGLSVLVFFGVGWSWKVVIHAAGVLFLLMGLAQGVSSQWRLNFSPDGPQLSTLWWQQIPTKGLALLVQSLERTAMAFTGHEDQLEIDLQTEPAPSIAWALRDFDQRKGETAFGLEASPVILTLETEEVVELPADYIGQSLGLIAARGWTTSLPPEPIRWLISQEVPTSIETWVLWVRADIASFGDLNLDS